MGRCRGKLRRFFLRWTESWRGRRRFGGGGGGSARRRCGTGRQRRSLRRWHRRGHLRGRALRFFRAWIAVLSGSWGRSSCSRRGSGRTAGRGSFAAIAILVPAPKIDHPPSSFTSYSSYSCARLGRPLRSPTRRDSASLAHYSRGGRQQHGPERHQRHAEGEAGDVQCPHARTELLEGADGARHHLGRCRAATVPFLRRGAKGAVRCIQRRYDAAGRWTFGRAPSPLANVHATCGVVSSFFVHH